MGICVLETNPLLTDYSVFLALVDFFYFVTCKATVPEHCCVWVKSSINI